MFTEERHVRSFYTERHNPSMGNPSWELLGVEWKYRHGFVLFSCSSPVTLGQGQRQEMRPTQPNPAQLIINPSDVNVHETDLRETDIPSTLQGGMTFRKRQFILSVWLKKVKTVLISPDFKKIKNPTNLYSQGESGTCPASDLHDQPWVSVLRDESPPQGDSPLPWPQNKPGLTNLDLGISLLEV